MSGVNRLAEQIDIKGLPSVERDVVELAHDVAPTEVRPTLVAVVRDSEAPEAASVGAFGLLACQIDRLRAASPRSSSRHRIDRQRIIPAQRAHLAV